MSGHNDTRQGRHDDRRTTTAETHTETRTTPHVETGHIDRLSDGHDGDHGEAVLWSLPTEVEVLTQLQGFGLVTGTEGADTLTAGLYDARLFGGAGNDTLTGGRGEDILLGGSGDDILFGGRAEDWLMGGSGNDVLDGGTGRDVLTGGVGADRFDLRLGGGRDRVTDFNVAEGDRIGLAAGTACTVTTGADGFAAVSIGNGDWLSLAGVQANQVNDGWFAVI